MNDTILTNDNLNKFKNRYNLNNINDESTYVNELLQGNFLENNNEYYKKITRINIDSRDRNIEPKNIIEGEIIYLNNAFSFTKDSNIVNVKTNKEHNLVTNDKIILQNVESNIVNLKGGIELTKNSYYVKINHTNHLINNSPNIDLFVEIKNAKGTSNNYTLYDNISLSLINNIHKIYLKTDTDSTISNDYFYIKLDVLPNSSITDNDSNIELIYKNIAGINLNEINSNYPININQINGNLHVNSVIDNFNFTILLNKFATTTIKNIGGNKAYYAKIKSFIPAYIKPNNYKINLNRTLENVIKIKLLSSEFPNTEKVVKKFPLELKNNLLYFQVFEDGDNIYEIEITQGNYNINGIINEIKTQIENIERKNYLDNEVISLGSNAEIQKSRSFTADIDISLFTDVFTMSLYSIETLIKAINILEEKYEDNHKRIIINHVNHGLTAGDMIQLQNCISTLYIPATILNATHNILYVIDSNNYVIKLPLHNEVASVTTETGGGSAIRILVPLKFRLLFDRPYTIGKLIGFRNINESNSITEFNTIISNNKPYYYDYYKDKVGNDINYDKKNNIIQNNSIFLSGDNYILMTCDAFKYSESSSSNNLNNIFAKLLLSESPGSILFNEFIQLSDVLEKPIKSLSHLEFKFFNHSGFLYEFEGLDHSFTLEITQLINKPKYLLNNFLNYSNETSNNVNKDNSNSAASDNSSSSGSSSGSSGSSSSSSSSSGGSNY